MIKSSIPLFFLSIEHVNQFDKFLDSYENQLAVFGKTAKPTIPKDQWRCRFCGRIGKETSWKKDAHLVSELLGNKNMLSYEECDFCNQLFSKLEDDLANYLGISRTINKVAGKRGIPKFKSADQKVVASIEDFFNGTSVSISKQSTNSDAFNIDLDKGITTIEVTKGTYIPLNVFKSFVKMGYAALPIDELKHYSFLRKFLLTEELDPTDSNSCILMGYSFPYNTGMTKPVLSIYKKKNSKEKNPTHVVLLFWQNNMFRFFLPFHNQDQDLYNGEPFSIIHCPPVFFFPPKEKTFHQKSHANRRKKR